MSRSLEQALAQEQFKHWIFPWILHFREEFSSWPYVAQKLNEQEIPTWSGKPWTRQNVERLFKSYWKERNGRYSWNEHGAQIAAMAQALGATEQAAA